MFLHQLTKEEFINLYQLSGKESALSHLEFKDDARKNLKQEDKEYLEFIDGCSDEELAEIEELKQQILQKRKIKETKEIIVPIEEIPDAVFATENSTTVNVIPTDTVTGAKIPNLTKKTQTVRIAAAKLTSLNKIVGDNNEKTVMKALSKQFNISETGDNYFITESGERVTLMGGSHKGYDIRIEKNGVITKRIEVKPYEQSVVSISPDQWDYAKQYQAEYAIYRVKKIIGQPSEIFIVDNPYQQFLDGKIELIPSRLKFLK